MTNRFVRRMFKRVGVGPSEPVYLLDLRQADGDHDIWAFTDPQWFLWADAGVGRPPRWLVRAAEIPPPPEGADRDTRLSYLAEGAFSAGEYVGRNEEELEEWLGSREVLGRLTGDQVDDE